MTAFAQLDGHPLLHALGWTLLYSLWQGAAIAALLAFALAALRGVSPQGRYAASCLALAAMMLAPVYTFARLATAAQPGSPHLLISAADGGQDSALRAGSAAGVTPLLDEVAHELDRSLGWVIGIWFAGVAVLLCRLNAGLFAAHRMKSLAAERVPAALESLVRELSRRLGIGRAIGVVGSGVVQAPALIGWIRPVILIPIGCIAGLTPLQVEALMAHELAHIRRHDYLVSVLQSAAEALFFYHPATWWISKQIRKEREHCCDDLAVAVCGDPLAYAKALTYLEEQRGSAPIAALAANGGELKMRIKRLLGDVETPDATRAAAITLFAAAFLAFGLWIAEAARAQSTESAATAEAGSQQLANQYRQWLDQDVRWIIAPEERRAFLQMHDDAERDQFIREFWERRNPSPGSADNRFKEEHYRRIAYANKRFSTAGEEGWRTDCGRIYIVYGPPDSIEVHPSGISGETADPVEIWHYRSVRQYAPAQVQETGLSTAVVVKNDIDMRFIDACRCGEYQLQPAGMP